MTPLPTRRGVLAAGAVLLALWAAPALAEKRAFEMTIEDTRINLVEQRGFHTFAFNGQVPGPLIHVVEGDDVEVTVTNMTTLPHTIHWHGMIQRGTWESDGVPDMTQKAIAPGETYTYRFTAVPSGTMWYHCHVNVNEHVAMRGMWGPMIVDPKKPTAVEKEVTKDHILMLSSWASQWADKPGQGGLPGDVFDYFTLNGKAFPDTTPITVKKGDVLRLRFIAAGDAIHSIHLHGHVFEVAFKDGHPLPAPYKADTLLIGPGERYDIIVRADNPGRWMIHDHVDSHTVNGDKPHGGIMTVIEYEGIPKDQPWYHWAHKAPVADFYYEESLKAGKHGLLENPAYKGTPAN
ncbi:MAG TPA: multicopper oxidase domain-containing protein [Azospirillaceae bacterium]|nr:multicopper oxidase domain-containing protein [Azospirillaceae bacterium]